MPIQTDITTRTESYRAKTQNQLWLDHRRKTCFCGSFVSSKQLAQYGACQKCYDKSKQAGEAA